MNQSKDLRVQGIQVQGADTFTIKQGEKQTISGKLKSLLQLINSSDSKKIGNKYIIRVNIIEKSPDGSEDYTLDVYLTFIQDKDRIWKGQDVIVCMLTSGNASRSYIWPNSIDTQDTNIYQGFSYIDFKLYSIFYKDGTPYSCVIPDSDAILPYAFIAYNDKNFSKKFGDYYEDPDCLVSYVPTFEPEPESESESESESKPESKPDSTLYSDSDNLTWWIWLLIVAFIVIVTGIVLAVIFKKNIKSAWSNIKNQTK